jgi:hypothetical protein
MFRRLVVAVLASLGVQSPTLAQTLEWAVENDTFFVARWRMQDEQLTAEKIQAFSEPIVAKHSGKPFIALQFFVPPSDKCLLESKGFHLGYRGWAMLADLCRSAPRFVAESITWRGGTCLRLRDGDRVAKQVTGATDPLAISAKL